MNIKRVFIIGAGPAGLACAYYLSKSKYDVKVFEQNEVVGGLARSWKWNGFNLDTGPHIFHTPVEEIKKDWEALFKSHLIKKDFYACNYRLNNYYDYPLNINQLEKFKEFEKDVKNLKLQNKFGDVASARSFEEYVEKLVGKNLAKAFFKEYPEKIWGIKTSKMSSEWAPKRIRITEKREKFFGNEYTAIGKKGTGEIMEIFSQKAQENGCEIKTRSKITMLKTKTIDNSLYIESIKFSSGKEIEINEDDLVLLTIPLTSCLKLINEKLDLKFRGTLSIYAELDKKIELIPKGYDWLYLQNSDDIINRLCMPTNWSKDIDIEFKSRSLIAAEISVDDKISNDELKEKIKKGYSSLKKLVKEKKGIIKDWTFNLERYVYPVKTLNSKKELAKAKKIFGNLRNLEVLGTGANFNYGDMQIMFLKAKELMNELNKKEDQSLSKIAFSNKYKNIFQTTRSTEQKVNIIAELGINHNGSFKELKGLIKSASNSGCRYIKFQHYTESERINKNSIENKLVEKAQDQEESTYEILLENKLTKEQLKEAKRYVEQNNGIPMTTVFGIESLKEALILGFNTFKIASMDLNNFLLHKEIISNQEKINELFISTGMSSLAEINSTLDLYKNSKIRPILMACTSSYPCTDDELNLNTIKTYKKYFLNSIKDVGYSDHSVGSTACLVAAAIGANYLEIHFTNSKDTRGPDHVLSATQEEVKNLRNELNRLEKMMGSFTKSPSASEYETWRLQKKGLYARNNIPKGKNIEISDLEMKSPPYGLNSFEFLNGSFISSRKIKKGEIISSDSTVVITKNKSQQIILSKIEDCKKISCLKAKKLVIVLVVTKNKNEGTSYTGGFRESENYIFLNIVNLSIEDLNDLSENLDNLADYIFVDSEKISNIDKNHNGNLFENFLKLVDKKSKQKIHPIRPSKITAQSAVNYIYKKYNSNGTKIGIIGIGGIGFRIFYDLAELGFTLNIFSKNRNLLDMKMEIIKNQFTQIKKTSLNCKQDINDILSSSEVLILCTAEKELIKLDNLKLINNNIKEVIEVGSNNLSNEAIDYLEQRNAFCHRLDIGNEIIKEIVSHIRTLNRNEILPKRVRKENTTYVSGGYIGKPGDIVVDDADNPNFIIGEIDSNGCIKK